MVDRLRLTRSRLLSWAGPSAASARHTCRRAWGRPQAATHELTGRGVRHGRGAATEAVRAGGAPCVEVLLGSCAMRGERPGRRAWPCRARSVPAPLPHDQPSSRSVKCREWGARAELEPWCGRGVRAGRSSACARADVSGVVECCASSE